jgi:large subunit ribosomal protein L12e
VLVSLLACYIVLRSPSALIAVKHDGNITLDEVINIARTMKERSMARTLAGTVKEVLGTARSVGCSIDGMNPQDVMDKIDEGEVEIPDQ